MVKYIIIHNKHEGCYDFHCYQDEVARIRMTSIRINPPILFMFNTRDEAQDFFEDYINDIDCIDIRCKKGEDVEHVEYCTCGCIELDDNDNPILFYNKKNQIFLLEHGPEIFMPHHELKSDIKNYNLTGTIMRRCKRLSREQRKKYIELGKFCEECNAIGKAEGEVSDEEYVGIFDEERKEIERKKSELKANKNNTQNLEQTFGEIPGQNIVVKSFSINGNKEKDVNNEKNVNNEKDILLTEEKKPRKKIATKNETDNSKEKKVRKSKKENN